MVHKQPTWCLSGEKVHRVCVCVSVVGTFPLSTRQVSPTLKESGEGQPSFLAPALTLHSTLCSFPSPSKKQLQLQQKKTTKKNCTTTPSPSPPPLQLQWQRQRWPIHFNGVSHPAPKRKNFLGSGLFLHYAAHKACSAVVSLPTMPLQHM